MTDLSLIALDIIFNLFFACQVGNVITLLAEKKYVACNQKRKKEIRGLMEDVIFLHVKCKVFFF